MISCPISGSRSGKSSRNRVQLPICYFMAVRRDRKRGLQDRKTIREIVCEQTAFYKEELDEVLEAKKMMGT